jgi:hypothetical protein
MLLPDKTSCMTDVESLFDRLVATGEQRALCRALPHQLHMFLVKCLVDHLTDRDLSHQIFATALLEASILRGQERIAQLKQVGDRALLIVGFFPERAARLNVSRSYFRDIGQSAYIALSGRLFAMGRDDAADCYNAVVRGFDMLATVLDAAHARHDREWNTYGRFRTLLM